MRRGTSGLNLIVALDKPAQMTSHDVVNVVRRSVGERRVGHAGTLDPAATGVMVIGIGQGTRLMGYLTAERKSYLARIAFGTETDTEDAEGTVIREAAVPSELADATYAREVVASIVGPQMQVPPAYSAISVKGERAYARARAGKEVELEPRPIEIFDSTLIAVDDTGDTLFWEVALTVSKGTYVRSIARDLGRRLGCAAHLVRLCRTSSGTVTLPMCLSLDAVREGKADYVVEHALDPCEHLGYPIRTVEDRELAFVQSGRTIELKPTEADLEGPVSVVHSRHLLGIWTAEEGLLRPQVNFPDGIMGVK